MNNNRGLQHSGYGKPYEIPDWDNFYTRLGDSVKQRKSSTVIKIADEIGTKLQTIEKTQMRKFLDEIVKIHPEQININITESEELDVNYKNKLAILRPRFAYTVTKKGNRDLKDFYMKVLDKWLAGADAFNKLDLEYLHLFIESLIAYHRVYAKK